MTAPHSRRTAARCLAIAFLLTGMSGCARNGVSASGVDSQQELQDAMAAARTAVPGRAEDDPAELTSPESRIGENLARGHREAGAGRLDQAARFYERVLREDPGNPIAHHRLAVIADQSRDFAEAERHYSAALEARPNDPDMLNDLGYCYLLQGRYPESEKTLRDAVAAAPSHERALTNLGLLYGTIGDSDRALAVLRMTGPETEARAKLAMMMPRSGTISAPAAPASFLADGSASGGVLPAGAFAPQHEVTPPSNDQPSEGEAMRDLMAQLDRAKREALAARSARAAVPGRLPGLIDPELYSPAAVSSAGPPQAPPAQPYSRSDRHTHTTARPEPPNAYRGVDHAFAPEARVPVPENPPAASGDSGELPLWSPQAAAMRSPQLPRAPGDPAGPAAWPHTASAPPGRDLVRYASAEAVPQETMIFPGTATGTQGAVTQLPPPAYGDPSTQGLGTGMVPQSRPGYGHAIAASPSDEATAAYRSPYEEPGMRAYADDLARRDAEVAEMHRYMESLRRPEAANGPQPALPSTDPTRHPGYPR